MQIDPIYTPANPTPTQTAVAIEDLTNSNSASHDYQNDVLKNLSKQASSSYIASQKATDYSLNYALNNLYMANTGSSATYTQAVSAATQALKSALIQSNSILSNIFNSLSEQTRLSISNALTFTQRVGNELKQDITEQADIIKMLASGQIQLMHMTATQDNVAVSPEEAVKLYQETIDSDKIKVGDYSGDSANCDDISLPSGFEGLVPLFVLGCKLKKFVDYLSSRENDIKVVINNLNDSQYHNLQEFWDAFYGKGVSGDTVAFFNTLSTFIPFIIKILNTSFAESNAELDRLTMRTIEPKRFDENTIIQSLRRGRINLDTYYDLMNDVGWSKKRAFDLLYMSTIYPTINELQEMYRRGLISRSDIENAFNDIGIDDKFLDNYEKLSWFIPPVQDVIRMAVRDVFTPDVVEQGGLFNDIPSEYVRRAKLSGLREEEAKLYWGAHWVIPSIQMGYEMHQRGVIDRQQLETLFKAADIAPNWRDKLLQISYNIPTRVDVRRMYEDGTINDNELQRYLLDYGYNEKDMQRVFTWYKKRRQKIQSSSIGNIKEITEGVIKSAYKENIISKSEAQQRLQKLGYVYQDADLILSIIDAQNTDKQDNKIADNIASRLFKITENAFKSFTIGTNEAEKMLSGSGLNAEEITAYISLWELELDLDRKQSIIGQLSKLYVGYEISAIVLKDTLVSNGLDINEAQSIVDNLDIFRTMRYKDLSRTDLKKAYSSNYITTDDYVDQLKGLGYSDDDIEIIRKIEGIK